MARAVTRNDFERDKTLTEAADIAAGVFATTGWTWDGFFGPSFTPDAVQIREELERLWVRLSEGDIRSTGTGRLVLQRQGSLVKVLLDLGYFGHGLASIEHVGAAEAPDEGGDHAG